MSVLDYHALNAPGALYKEHRVGVLFFLILHANVRLRCWPSVDRIVEKTTISRPVVIKAVKWLEEHCAIELVPFNKRVDDELQLPPRQHVYQLTGFIEWEGERIKYLYFSPINGDRHTQSKDSLLSKVKNLDDQESLPKLGIDSPSGNHSESKETRTNFTTSEDVKNAFAIMCYGTKDAWKLNAKVMSKAIRDLCKYEDRAISKDDLIAFRQWWKTKDFRGKQRQLPEPYVVTSVWARFRGNEESTETLAEPTKPAPKRQIVVKKKGESSGV